jgi:hypothetical protein
MKDYDGEKYYREIRNKYPEVSEEENEKMQAALKSQDITKEKEMLPEEEEEYEKILEGVRNVLQAFELKRSKGNKKGENLILVTDLGVDKIVRKALEKAGRELAGPDFRLIVSTKPDHAAQDFLENVDETIKHADAVLYATSISRSHSKGTIELLSEHPDERIRELQNLRRKQRGVSFISQMRLISITNAKKEVFTEGAALENPDEIKRRGEGLAEYMKQVKYLHITSPEGTNLILKPKKEATPEYESGKVDKPGKISNFPMGEWGTAVDLSETNGILVVDGAVTMIGRLEKPVKIRVEKGMAVDIIDGEQAKKIKELLEQANEEYKQKNTGGKADAFRLAEIGIGTNSKAFRFNERGEKICPPTSLEAEKGLGTIHIALGKNSLFSIDKNDPDCNDIPIHLDHVVMHPEITAELENGRKIPMIKNGELLI